MAGAPVVASRLRRAAGRMPYLRHVWMRTRWASLQRSAPISERWGFDRGTPIDRWYIERFLDSHRADVHGHVLEVLEDRYATRLGAGSVDVLDIDTANAKATVVGDVCDPATLRGHAFDAVVLTQTLQFVRSPRHAVENLVAALRPGGTMLISVPAVSKVADEFDRWRWTPAGVHELTAGLPCSSEVNGAGNMLACRAFLMGMALEDLPTASLAIDDPVHPLLVTARLHRSGG